MTGPKFTLCRRLSVIAAAFLGLVLGLEAAPAAAQAPAPITIVVFNPPSLGAFLPDVIKKEGFDKANGLDLTFVERTPDAYTAQFDSGEFQVGGSAALLTVGVADLRGVKTSYLFNLFDYWGAVVTHRPNIKSLADLKGKQLAAAAGTTNYRMFLWFAHQQGLDTSSLQVLNTAPPGLVGYALADRADAIELWEPAYTLLIAKQPDIRTLHLDIAAEWKKFTGSPHSPYLGVAAHQAWIAQHRTLIAPLYRTYLAAARWVAAHPDEAAPLIAPKADAAGLKAIANLVRDNTRLGMNVSPAGTLEKEIDAVYRAGVSIGYLQRMPSASTVYGGKM
ncbi:MAG TPA: ABC transporter substrate-binding protein [Alphaproteobacteria bacterium]|nr:ABC transporter substrate-binding protein [Alphaproteobacteria bacterium]